MKRAIALAVLSALSTAGALPAQTFAANDPVLQRIWSEGMEHSRTWPLAQALMDSIGPRLTGSPQLKAGNDWLRARYAEWGVRAENEQYGTWRGWRRGITHLDLVQPRVRTLEAMLLAWSDGTGGRTVEGRVVLLPEATDSAAFREALRALRNTFVLASPAEMTCRTDDNLREYAAGETVDSINAARRRQAEAWRAREEKAGLSVAEMHNALAAAGVKGILTSRWSRGWGVNKIFGTRVENVPVLDVSCEDYGLLYRLAEAGQGPVVRLAAEGSDLGEVPVYNTIATIPGSARPDEYVMLSAHFDSWDGGSGATDNGTGTIVMLEAMRILREAYPQPKRTIVAGHWGGEEQGLNGSRAFMADHPEIVKGLAALFNQDNGTGRIVNMSGSGLLDAGPFLARWLTRVPQELSRQISLSVPGTPASGGSDMASAICYGAPGYSLGSTSYDYGTYTWHTNRDTFDKIVFEDLRNNATLVAMLVYLAAEDPGIVARDRRVMPQARDGSSRGWPECQTPARKSSDSTR